VRPFGFPVSVFYAPVRQDLGELLIRPEEEILSPNRNPEQVKFCVRRRRICEEWPNRFVDIEKLASNCCAESQYVMK